MIAACSWARGSQDTADSVTGCPRAAGAWGKQSSVSDISTGLRADTGEGASQSHLNPCPKCLPWSRSEEPGVQPPTSLLSIGEL